MLSISFGKPFHLEVQGCGSGSCRVPMNDNYDIPDPGPDLYIYGNFYDKKNLKINWAIRYSISKTLPSTSVREHV